MPQRRNGAYKPSYSVTEYHQPWYRRLTPLAWVMVGIAGFLVLFGISVMLGRIGWGSPSAQARSIGLSGLEGSPTAIPAIQTAVPELAFGATATPRPAVTRAPTRTPRPTSEPVAPVLLSTPTGEPTSVPALDWTAIMTQTVAGEWMAPETEVQRTQRDVLAYFEALRNFKSPEEARRELIEQPDRFLGRFFEGEALRAARSTLDVGRLNILKEGETDVRVVRYSKDGSLAVVTITKRGWVYESLDKDSLQDAQRKPVPDESVTWQVRYSTVEGRWKVMNITALPSNGDLFSAEGAKAFDAFFKKTVNENK